MKSSLSLKEQTFSGKRFSLCLGKYLGENWRRLVLQVLVGFGVLLAAALLSGLTNRQSYRWIATDGAVWMHDPGLSTELPFFIFLSMIFAAISASMVFKDLASKEGRIYRLTSPASQLEKYLVGIVIYVVAFIVLLVGGIILADGVRVVLFRLFTPWGIYVKAIIPYMVEECVNDSDAPTVYTLFALAMLFGQSLFVIGSAVWPKGAFIKTAIAIGIIGMIYAAVIGVSSQLVPEVEYSQIYMTKNSEAAAIVTYIVAVTAIIINYCIAYLRYKETDVIDRW